MSGFPVIGHQYPSKVRMIQEVKSNKIISLSLVPVGASPDFGNRFKIGIFSRNRNFEHNLVLQRS